MNVFGPFSSRALQSTVDHAERFCASLAELRADDDRPSAAAWLAGRVDEVACFVEHIAGEWRAGTITADAATTALGAYLDALHHGLARHFVGACVACCDACAITRADPIPSAHGSLPGNDAEPPMLSGEITTMDVDPAELLNVTQPLPPELDTRRS